MSAPTPALHLDFKDEDATRRFAERLGTQLCPGDVILLEGGIGAGKTALCRALIKSRLVAEDRDEDVPSPTFTLVQVYELSDGEIWHADLYRLTHPDEVIELGLDGAFETAICLVEWPDRLGDLVPETALTIAMDVTGDNSRRATLRYSDPKWAERLDDCLKAVAS